MGPSRHSNRATACDEVAKIDTVGCLQKKKSQESTANCRGLLLTVRLLMPRFTKYPSLFKFRAGLAKIR